MGRNSFMCFYLNRIKTISAYSFSSLAIFLFALLLPVKISLSNFFLITYFVISLFAIVKNKKVLVNPAILYSAILLFIPLLIGFFYTAYFDNAIHDIIKKNSFLLIPLFLSFESKDNLQRIYNYAKNGLLLGVISTLLFLIINIVYIFIFVNKEVNYVNLFNFNYTRFNFIKSLKIHPTYLGVYVVFSVILITNLVYRKKIKIKFFGVLFVLFFLGIVFINQRIVFLFYGLVIMASILFYLRFQILKKTYLKFLVTTILIIFFGVLSFKQIKKTYIYYRFTKELNWEFSNDVNSFYIKGKEQVSDPRLARWKSIIELINEKPILGYGIGSEKKVLSKMFKSKGMLNSYEQKYDAHNQYLSVLVEFGFLGLLFFLFFIIFNLYYAVKFRNIEFIGIMIILIVVSLTENILSRNNGITFFIFFSTLYLFKSLNLKEKYE